MNIEKNVHIYQIFLIHILSKKIKVFVLSSNFEGFPNSLLEVSLGVKVISTNCESGPSEILENGKYGTLVETNNKHMLSSAIINSLNNNENKKLTDEILINMKK